MRKLLLITALATLLFMNQRSDVKAEEYSSDMIIYEDNTHSGDVVYSDGDISIVEYTCESTDGLVEQPADEQGIISSDESDLEELTDEESDEEMDDLDDLEDINDEFDEEYDDEFADEDLDSSKVESRSNKTSKKYKIDKVLIKYATEFDDTTQEEDEELIYKFLIGDMHLSNAAACGVLSNIKYESEYSNIAIGDSGTSYGLCQWHAERFVRLRKYCGSRGMDYRTTESQLKYLEYELTTGYSDVLDYLRGVDNSQEGAYDAASYWCINFEMPADMERKAVNRGRYSEYVLWKKYQNRFLVYRINYDVYLGENDTTNPFAYSSLTESIELKPAYMEGYVFDGWFLDPDYAQPITAITSELSGDIKLYAKWRECDDEELASLEEERIIEDAVFATEEFLEESVIDDILGLEVSTDSEPIAVEDIDLSNIVFDDNSAAEYDVLIGMDLFDNKF